MTSLRLNFDWLIFKFTPNPSNLQGSRRFFKISIVGEYNNARRLGFSGIASRLMARYSRVRNRMYSTRGLSSLRSAVGRRQRRGRQTQFSLRRKKRGTSGIGVTAQHDARVIYRKRSMPRGKRRGWRRFKNKVNAVAEKDLGTQQEVFNYIQTTTNTNPVNSCRYSFTLYGMNGIYPHSDLYRMSGDIAAAALTLTTGLPVSSSTKMLFQSGVLDLTIRNSSMYNDAGTYRLTSEARMEVDVYELIMRKASDINGTFQNSLEACFAYNPARTDAIGGVSGASIAEIDYTQRGVTPFDLSFALSRFGIKILSKTKYQISNGDQVTYQIRDPKRHVITVDEAGSGGGFNKPGMTRIVYIVGKLAPGLTIGTTPGTYQEQLTFGCTRKYMYKIENYSEDRTLYRY